MILDTLTTLLVARFYIVPRVRRAQRDFERQGKAAFAAIAGLTEPVDTMDWAQIAAAARTEIAAQTRSALKAEFPGFIDEFAPTLEARFTEKMLPAIEGKVKESIPALVTELAPVIGEALVSAGQRFFAEKRPSNIETLAGQRGMEKIPPQIDVAELLKNPQVQGLAQQYGIDTSSLKGLPAKIAVPQGSNPLAVLSTFVPQLKPIVGLLDALKMMGGTMGGGAHAPAQIGGGGPSTESDRAFADRVLRR